MIDDQELLKYCIDAAYKVVKEVCWVQGTFGVASFPNENEVIYRVGNFLLWFNAIRERYFAKARSDLEADEIKLLDGLRVAFNCIKHTKLIELQRNIRGGFTFPISFPFVIPAPQIIWAELSDASDLWQPKDYQRYKVGLQGRSILSTIDRGHNLALKLLNT